MMRSILPILISFTFVTVFSMTARSFLRRANNKIWHSNILDTMAVWLPYVSVAFFVAFGLAVRLEWPYILPVASTGLSILLILSLIMVLTLPVSMLIRKIMVRGHVKNQAKKPMPMDENRRRFLKTAAAALPLISIATTTNGFAGAFQKIRIPEIVFTFKNLPKDLDGFRILHLSDMHLGYYFNLAELEKLLQDVEHKSFDMVAITGDVADDLNQLGEALTMIDQLKTSHPKFVSIGNHEYFRGIHEVRRQMDAGPIDLLLNEHRVLRIKDTDLVIAGADDPIRMRADISEFLDNTVETALQGAPSESFKLILSHRPGALDVADKHQVDLVLAGHTHGGQMGINNRSLFENIIKEPYLWGKYNKGRSQLYTSSGVGHWFPFRLGCPAEAPLIILKRA